MHGKCNENIEPSFVNSSNEFSGQHCQISAMDSTHSQGGYASLRLDTKVGQWKDSRQECQTLASPIRKISAAMT